MKIKARLTQEQLSEIVIGTQEKDGHYPVTFDTGKIDLALIPRNADTVIIQDGVAVCHVSKFYCNPKYVEDVRKMMQQMVGYFQEKQDHVAVLLLENTFERVDL